MEEYVIVTYITHAYKYSIYVYAYIYIYASACMHNTYSFTYIKNPILAANVYVHIYSYMNIYEYIYVYMYIYVYIYNEHAYVWPRIL